MLEKMRWGFSAAEWQHARHELEMMLAEVGRSRSTVTYGEVARRAMGGRVGARSSALMALLGEVDREADERLGCMVASLVVRADTGMPGDGYFGFAAQQLGRPIADARAFWAAEVQRVWDAYAPQDCPPMASQIALRGASAGESQEASAELHPGAGIVAAAP